MPLGFSLAPFPSGKGAWVDTELPGEILLSGPECRAMVDDLLCQGVTLLERVEAEKFDDLGHVVDARGGISLLPIYHRHFIAADDFGHVELAELEVEPPLADFFTQGFWGGGIALLLRRVWPPWATQPT